VEFDPKAWREGRDPQLEKAVELVLHALENYMPPRAHRPPYPTHGKTNGSATQKSSSGAAGAPAR
jgi:hypothetical protein